jgi:glycosyltransferase involved in cell wall biosynthesis
VNQVSDNKINVVFPHRAGNIGGPSTFQRHLQDYLINSGNSYSIYPFISDTKKNVILVVGGTRRIIWLSYKKLSGLPIVLRLDGKTNYVSLRRHGVLFWSKSKLVDLSVWLIRVVLANYVVYQSRYVQTQWVKSEPKGKKTSIIHNGAVISNIQKIRDSNVPRIVCVEGCVQGALAISILHALKDFKIDVFGRLSDEVLSEFTKNKHEGIKFHGPISHEAVIKLLRQKIIFINLETNPPCPNSVIEALCNGNPVLGFDSGSLKELVGDAGIVLPYYNSTGFSSYDINPLVNSLNLLVEQYDQFSSRAFSRSRLNFSVDDMFQAYYQIFKKV